MASRLGGLPKYRFNCIIVVNFVQDELSLLSLTPQNSPHVDNQSRSDPGFMPSMFLFKRFVYLPLYRNLNLTGA